MFRLMLCVWRTRDYLLCELRLKCAKCLIGRWELRCSRCENCDESSITAWVGKHGVNVANFTAAFRSFNVTMSAGQAEQKAEDYRVPGVPALTIAGKYMVEGGDRAKMLATSDQLIVMARVASKTGR